MERYNLCAGLLFFLMMPYCCVYANKINQQQDKYIYQSYLQIGEIHRHNSINTSNDGLLADIFIPVWQKNNQELIFTDIRINDPSGASVEGNAHIGYRHLSFDNKSIFGIYGACDRKRTFNKNYFSQVMIGGELWRGRWFVGANVYKPIGVDNKGVDQEIIAVSAKKSPVKDYHDIKLTLGGSNEKAIPGVDTEIGYEFREGLVGYIGGYYFGSSQVATVCGPKARLTYDWSLDNGRILGIFDKIGLETSIQYDKPRSAYWYVSVNLRVGWLPGKKSQLTGVSRHMIDPVRRDIDIISSNYSWQKQENQAIKYNIDNSINATVGKIANGRKFNPEAQKQIVGYLNDYQSNIRNSIIIKHSGSTANILADLAKIKKNGSAANILTDLNNIKNDGSATNILTDLNDIKNDSSAVNILTDLNDVKNDGSVLSSGPSWLIDDATEAF